MRSRRGQAPVKKEKEEPWRWSRRKSWWIALDEMGQRIMKLSRTQTNSCTHAERLKKIILLEHLQNHKSGCVKKKNTIRLVKY
jgi:hypothetical protein